jgi:flagellar biosynthesis protein FliQ
MTTLLARAILLAALLAAPIALAIVAAGVASALLQGATRVREHSLAALPKLAAALVAAALTAPLVERHLVDLFRAVVHQIASVGR